MEFNRLLSQAISFYGENTRNSEYKIDKENKVSEIDINKYKNILYEKDLDFLINKLNNKSIISVDCETSSLNPINAELVGISFSCDVNEAYYIPVAHKNVRCLNIELVLKKVKKILEDQSIKKIGQNIKYDLIILKKYNIDVSPIEDTMLLSYTLDAGNNRHNMDTLSEIHLGHKTISYKEIVGSGKKQLNFSEVNLKDATKYAAEDADVTLRLYNILKGRVDNEKLNKIYEVFEKPMVRLLSKLEIIGIKIDDSYLKQLSKKFEERLIKRKKKFIKFLVKNLILDHQSNSGK